MKNSVVNEDIQKSRIEFLKKIELFEELDSNELNFISNTFHPKKFRKKEIIFHQGDDSRSSFLILKGKVRIVRINESGNETSISIYSENDIIGEFSAVDGSPRSATVQALEDCVLLEIEYSKFLKMISEMPVFAMGLIKVLVKKLRWATSFAETIAQYDTAGRLLHILLYYNDILGVELEAGKKYELSLSMNQSDLASLVGARREWINRILQDWKKNNLIVHRNGRITILDLPAVKKERDRRTDYYLSEESKW